MEPTDFHNPTAGKEFVRRGILTHLGCERRMARLKGSPEDFQVEEVGLDGTRFTVTPSGIAVPTGLGTIESGGASTGIVRVTVVKRGLTTGHVESLIRKLLRDKGYDVRVSYAGNKDRIAVTAQEYRIEGAPIEVVASLCSYTPPTGRGFCMFDPAYAPRHLMLGDLMGNCFRVRLHIPGMSASEILAYMTERVALMADRGWKFPNAYGKQRRGRCQMNDVLGYIFLQLGPEAAFKQMLTVGAPDESQFAKDVRAALAAEWAKFEAAKARGASIDEQFLSFVDMHQILVYGPDPQRWGEPIREAVHLKVNMPIEFSVVNLAAKFRNFDEVAKKLRRELSLWVGAIQGYWYNETLAAYLEGQVELPPDGEIPLLVNRPKAVRFYHRYFPHAIPGRLDRRGENIVDGLHPLVRRFYFQPNSSGPTRAPFATVTNFQFKVGHEEVFVENMLPPGAFETTFLSMFFDLDSAYASNNGAVTEVAESEE